MLDVRQQGRTLTHERHAAPEQISGGTHLSRIPRGLWQHATAEQHGDLMSVDRIVFGFAAMDGLHVQRMAEDKRNPFLGTQVSEPVPGEESIRPPQRHHHDRAQ